MSEVNTIANIDEIYKGLTKVDGGLNNLSATFLKIIKNVEDFDKTSKNLTQTTENLNKSQKETTKIQTEKDAANKQLAASEQKLASFDAAIYEQLQRNNKALADNKKAINDKIKASESEEGSLVRMRQKLSELTAQYDKTGVRTKAATNEINNLSREIGKAEAATNRHQRGVGGYADQLGKFRGVVSSLPGPLGSAMGAAEGLVTKLGAFGPVGLWIGGAIMSIGAPLAAFFLKSELGVEMLERKIAGFKASISVLVGELIKSGEKMAESFDKPAKSTFWTSVLSTFGPSMGALGARMDYAKVAAEEYTGKLQEMEDAERKLIVPRAEANLKIKEAMLLYADENKPLQVRINALKEAIKLENATADVEIKMAHDRVVNLIEINKQKEDQKQLRDADDLALQNAIAKEIDLRTESAGRQVRAAKRIQTGIAEITKEQENSTKKRTEEEQKVVDAWVKGMYEKMDVEAKFLAEQDKNRAEQKKEQDDLLKWLETSDADEIEQFNKKEEAKTKKAKEEADKKKEIEEDLKKAQIDLATEAGNAIFEFRNMAFQKEMNQLQVEKDNKLSNSKLTTEQRAKIEAEYEKKANVIKAKQAQNEKLQALFQIALQTAVGAAKSVAESPLTFGMPFIAFVLAQGLLQAALVATRPIPKYAKGTKSAEREGIFGEAGRELMFPVGGGAIMADKETYFEGSKFKGAKILSNPETERMMGMVADRNIIVKNQTDDRLLNKMDELKKAIIQKPIAIYDKDHRMIGQGNSQYQEYYMNRLINRN